MPRLTLHDAALEILPLAIAAAKAKQGRKPARLYWEDPVAWLHDRIRFEDGEAPTAYQEEALHALASMHRASIRGPHGLGKTSMGAWALMWFVDTRSRAGVDWKAVVTAGSWGQLRNFFWPEVHKWHRRARGFGWREGSELLQTRINLATGEAFAVASNRPELIEGAHADSILYIYDEAKSIAEATYDASEGAFSGAVPGSGREAFAWAASTPGAPVGRFSDIHHRRSGFEDWWARHVLLEEAVAAGRISMEWAEQRAKQWGRTSTIYKNRVLGEFAADDANTVIPLAWIEEAQQRWLDMVAPGDTEPAYPPLHSVGVDVARYGDDESVIAPRYGMDIIGALRPFTGLSTTELAGNVAGILRAHGRGFAMVDVIGLGAGVIDVLREAGYPARAFNASTASILLDRSGELGFTNRRAAAWWMLRESLDPTFGSTIALPPDDDLVGDLTAPTYRVVGNGKIQIEPKDDTRKRLGHSPDHADAVVMVMAPPDDSDWEGVVTYDDPVDIGGGF